VIAFLIVKVRPCAIALLQTPLVWCALAAPFVGGWCLLAFAVVPALVLLALPFAHWDAAPTADSMGAYSTIRGDLPAWLGWLATPDERLPGGTYEPTVWSVYQARGRFICAWYWLGWRNQLHGLAWYFRRPLPGPWSPLPGRYALPGSDLWWARLPIPLTFGRFQFKAGYRNFFVEGAWYGVPSCTITRA
jgi:hypothetical protein